MTVLTDRANCGACGNACEAGDICERGRCIIDCADDLDACGDVCVDFSDDAAHCGRCDNACGAEQMCMRGRCRCNDDVGTACGAECVDTATNPAHCGGCGDACAETETCAEGMCVAGPMPPADAGT